MLKNITHKQEIFLWILIILSCISVIFFKTLGILFGCIFLISVFNIEVWNNATEKQYLKKRVEELELIIKKGDKK